MRNYILWFEKYKTIDSHFKVIGQPSDTFKSIIIMLKTALLSVSNSNQHLMLTTIKSGLLAIDIPLKDHPMVDAIIFFCIGNYQMPRS